MDLKGNQITVGELLDYPPAGAVIRRRFPMLRGRPLMGAARTMTLEQVLSAAGGFVSGRVLEDCLSELRQV